jgi:hypothetical protein
MPGRKVMMEKNTFSLLELESGDWIQTMLYDEDVCGIGAAQVRLADQAEKLRGDYIWILDDDDRCIRPSLLNELKMIVAKDDPDVIIVKMDHGPRGVLPTDEVWGERPSLGQIGSSGYIIRRSLWQEHADAFRTARYTSDFDFIDSIWVTLPVVYWHDVIASEVQMIGLGQRETV